MNTTDISLSTIQTDTSLAMSDMLTHIHNSVCDNILQLFPKGKATIQDTMCALHQAKQWAPRIIQTEYLANRHWLNPTECSDSIPDAGLPLTYAQFHIRRLLMTVRMKPHYPSHVLRPRDPEDSLVMGVSHPHLCRSPGQRYKGVQDGHSRILIVPPQTFHLPKLGLISLAENSALALQGDQCLLHYPGGDNDWMGWVSHSKLGVHTTHVSIPTDYTKSFVYDAGAAAVWAETYKGTITADMPPTLLGWEVDAELIDSDIPF